MNCFGWNFAATIFDTQRMVNYRRELQHRPQYTFFPKGLFHDR